MKNDFFYILAYITLLLIIQLFYGLNISNNYKSIKQWIDNTQDIINTTQKISIAIVDAETGQRGYLLTKKDEYLQPYLRGVSTAKELREELKLSTSDNRSQQERVAKLFTLIDKKLDELNTTITLAKNHPNSTAYLDIVNSNVGKLYMDNIRTTLEHISKEEKAILLDRKNSLEETYVKYYYLIGVEIFIIIIFIFVYKRKNDKLAHFIKEIVIARKNAENSTIKFKQLLQNASDGIHILDTNGDVIECSQSFADSLGYSYKETLNLNIKDWDSSFSKDQLLDLIHDLMNHPRKFETKHKRKDGKIIDVQVNAKGVNMDDVKYLYASSRDITDIKNKEGQLKLATNAAKQSNRAKSAFLANMSHEIRTPLNGIIGLSDLTLKQSNDKSVKENMQKVLVSSRSLLNVIRDILDYSKIEAGKLEITPQHFNIETLLSDVANLFYLQAEEKEIGLHLKIDPSLPLHLIGDSLRITQILNNLVSNALKFTDEGDIVISAKTGSISNKKLLLILSVKDNGKGIAEENLHKLFKAFSQEDASVTRKYGGTGLGLHITNKLINLMGGEINVKSKVNKGSTFEVRLTLDIDSKYPLHSDKTLQNKKILIIDDNETERLIIDEMLKSWGVESNSFADPKKALEDALMQNYDYIIVDWKMPQMDGVEFISKLHTKRPELPPVIMVSAYDKNELLKQIQEQNVYVKDVLHKPFVASTLYNTLSNKDSKKTIMTDETDEIKFKGSVLLAEDNEVNQIVAMEYLKNFGCSVDLAQNGIEAYKMASQKEYDIIFMDLHMPDMDGYEATKHIRQSGSDIPIVALSAAAMESDKKRSLEVGMDEHISKPIDLDELEYILRSYLKADNSTPKIEGINAKKLYSTISDKKIIIKMLNSFIKQYSKIDELFESTLPISTLRDNIHGLKGVSGQLCIDELYELSKSMHDNKDDEYFMKNLNYLTKLLDTTIKRINKSLKDIESEDQEDTISKNEAIENLKSSINLLKSGRYLDQEYRHKISKSILTLGGENIQKNIDASLDSFEFDKTLSIISKLLEDIDVSE